MEPLGNINIPLMLTQREIAKLKLLILLDSSRLSLIHELQSVLLRLIHGNRSSIHSLGHHILQFNGKSLSQ